MAVQTDFQERRRRYRGKPGDPYQKAVSGRTEWGSTRPTDPLLSPFGSGQILRRQWLVPSPGYQQGSVVWTSALVPAVGRDRRSNEAEG